MFLRLNSLLKKKFANHNLRSQVQAAQVVELAKKELQSVLGIDILEMCQPVSVRDGVLSVAVLSSVAAQEIRLRQKNIVTGINKRLGQETVTSIRFIQ